MYFTSADFFSRNKKKTKLSANCTGCNMNITCYEGMDTEVDSTFYASFNSRCLSLIFLNVEYFGTKPKCQLSRIGEDYQANLKIPFQQLLTLQRDRPCIRFLIKTSITIFQNSSRPFQNNKYFRKTFSVFEKSHVDAADIKATLETLFLPRNTQSDLTKQKKDRITQAR